MRVARDRAVALVDRGHFIMADRAQFRPSMKLPRHRTIAGVLASDAHFAEWTQRHRRETALTLLLRKHLPRPVAERIRVTEARGGVLEIAAGGSAIAATLRQRVPALRAALARDGWDFTEIRVRVQVAGMGVADGKSPPRQWDSGDATPLFDLADRLPDGPLKSALARWSRRARGR